MVKISFSKKLSGKELSSTLKELSDIINQGEGTLKLDGYQFPLTISESLEFEIELESGSSENKLELELKWDREEQARTAGVEELPVEQESKIEAPNYVGSGVESAASLQAKETVSKGPMGEDAERGISAERGGEQMTEKPAEYEVELELDKRMENILNSLSSELEKSKVGGEEMEVKPHGNLFSIAEEPLEKQGSGISVGSGDTVAAEKEKLKIPEYESVIEGKEAVTGGELETEKTVVKGELEEDELSSTDDLQLILKALKESRLNKEEKEKS